MVLPFLTLHMTTGSEMLLEIFAQSYYGWKFYRASAWHWPIGLMDGVADPSLTPIMYIDSVPLLMYLQGAQSCLACDIPVLWDMGFVLLHAEWCSGSSHYFPTDRQRLFFCFFVSVFCVDNFFHSATVYTHCACRELGYFARNLLIVTNSERRSPVKHVVLWGLLFFWRYQSICITCRLLAS